jgi:molybdopterin-containing oxidoreductase family membrane subunit
MSSHYEATIRKPLVIGDKLSRRKQDVAAPVEGKANKHWWIVFSIALTAFLWGMYNFTLYQQESEHGD